ncbi:MAG: hypothetical protein PGN16_03960 [Sphingomonas phyllosphaerae]|uniref:hypothetical protein n=1 Tax=Sphingomonas phyllosphaerae TaxID=257003 RepID=UPI002FFA864B
MLAFPGTYTFYDYSSADMLAAFIAGESCGQTTMAMDAAPKDGTMLRLLVDYTDGGGPLDDALTAWTIGFNDLVNTGVDEWKFAGWCWTHDHFSQGSGTPVGWLPWSNPSTGGDEQ